MAICTDSIDGSVLIFLFGKSMNVCVTVGAGCIDVFVIKIVNTRNKFISLLAVAPGAVDRLWHLFACHMGIKIADRYVTAYAAIFAMY